MCSWFLKELAHISPTYVILGNHDTNLKNDTRQDSISPIINALNNPNLTLWKYSGERIINDNLAFNVLSLIDEDKWVKPSDPNRINIALYHGAIAGVSTDIGYTLEHSDHELSIFADFDYALLGDIHKSNQIVDTEGRVRYPGSTIQQNHGETDDKGFLIWEIENKDKFDTESLLFCLMLKKEFGETKLLEYFLGKNEKICGFDSKSLSGSYNRYYRDIFKELKENKIPDSYLNIGKE
jgi:DNA repair exonuclease SbcCD nuclease subunit